jgi:hypothetical protein
MGAERWIRDTIWVVVVVILWLLCKGGVGQSLARKALKRRYSSHSAHWKLVQQTETYNDEVGDRGVHAKMC